MNAHEADRALTSCALICINDRSLWVRTSYALLIVEAIPRDIVAAEISDFPFTGMNSLLRPPPSFVEPSSDKT